MANPFSKGWKYLTSALDAKIEENADPEIQIHQAVEHAKAQHSELVNQATQLIGTQKQLEMKLHRLREEQAKLADKARQALQLVDDAESNGDSAKAAELNQAAEVYATQLVNLERELEDTARNHEQASQVAEQAKQRIQESEAQLKQYLSQTNELQMQAKQAKMHEASAKTLDNLTLTEDGSTPTLDQVRDKIERRYANALGAQELMESDVHARVAEIESGASDLATHSRLDQIRAELAAEKAKELEAPEEKQD